MARVKAEGVVLSIRDRGEADQLVTFLTPEEGPMRTIARQAKRSIRRFGGRLGLFNRLHLVYTRKKPLAPVFLEETGFIERFSAITKDPVLFGRCASLAEIIQGAWGEGEPARNVYEFFLQYLRVADRGKIDTDRYYLEAFRLLELLGHRPALNICVNCGNKLDKTFYYSLIGGGTVCNDCARDEKESAGRRGGSKPIRVSKTTVSTIEAALNMKHDKIGRLKFSRQGRKEVHKLWIEQISALLGRMPRSFEYLKKIRK